MLRDGIDTNLQFCFGEDGADVGHLLQGQVQCLHVLPASHVFSFKMAAYVAFYISSRSHIFCKFLPTATILSLSGLHQLIVETIRAFHSTPSKLGNFLPIMNSN